MKTTKVSTDLRECSKGIYLIILNDSHSAADIVTASCTASLALFKLCDIAIIIISYSF